MKEYKVYLIHILEAINRIQRYIEHISYKSFLENDEKKDAVIRNIEIIGEAAAKVPKACRKQYLSIPWRDVIDMRNRLIHEYFGVDYQIVWNVIEEELPLLKKHITKILHET